MGYRSNESALRPTPSSERRTPAPRSNAEKNCLDETMSHTTLPTYRCAALRADRAVNLASRVRAHLLRLLGVLLGQGWLRGSLATEAYQRKVMLYCHPL